MSITLKMCKLLIFFVIYQSCKILKKAEDLQLSNQQNPERRKTTTTTQKQRRALSTKP